MVFKHLQDLFDSKDFVSNFSQLYLVYSYVVAKCIFRNIIKALGARRLLALAKPFDGIWLIIIGEIFIDW